MTAPAASSPDVLADLTPAEFDAVLVMISAAFRDLMIAEANLIEAKALIAAQNRRAARAAAFLQGATGVLG